MKECVFCGNANPDAYKCDDCRRWVCGDTACEKEHDEEHREEEREQMECPECGRWGD